MRQEEGSDQALGRWDSSGLWEIGIGLYNFASESRSSDSLEETPKAVPDWFVKTLVKKNEPDLKLFGTQFSRQRDAYRKKDDPKSAKKTISRPSGNPLNQPATM